MQQTWVQSLGWEDPLEKKMATYPSILAWRIPGTEKEAWWTAVHGVAKNQTRLSESDMTIVNSMSTHAHTIDDSNSITSPSMPAHLPAMPSVSSRSTSVLDTCSTVEPLGLHMSGFLSWITTSLASTTLPGRYNILFPCPDSIQISLSWSSFIRLF